MKFFLFLAFLCLATLNSCKEEPKGLTVKGTIQGGDNLQVFLDKAGLAQSVADQTIARGQIQAGGSFSIVNDVPITEGLYRLRIGQQFINLVLDGTESNIEINGNIAQLPNYQYTVKGSTASEEYLTTIQRLIAQAPSINDIINVVNGSSNPLIGLLITLQAVGTDPSGLNVHQLAMEKLKSRYPNSTYTQEYAAFIAQVQAVTSSVGNSSGYSFVEETNRKAAPEISLPGPNGNNYSLSSLKGKVVLLDFWASWCGPCRVENPNVVEVYNRYKDKGFTVFSVSLDGIDDGQQAAMSANPAQLKQMLDASKESWKKAIQDDRLTWEYHVSDLKKWDCVPAKAYGVSSIPRAFVLDREGRIAATGVRGAEQIEETIKKLL